MADAKKENTTKNGNGTTAQPTPQPLAQKSEAQLKRETRARLKHLDPVTATELLNETVGKQVTSSLSGFVDFLREHAIVGLAVGFVLATQVQSVVKQLISSFIDPLSQLLLGGEALSNRYVWWHLNGHAAKVEWGAFVYALIDFLFVAVAIYAIIKIFKLDKLDKQT